MDLRYHYISNETLACGTSPNRNNVETPPHLRLLHVTSTYIAVLRLYVELFALYLHGIVRYRFPDLDVLI